MKQLYADIENWMYSLHDGWCSLEKAESLVGMIMAIRPKLIVEIGIWSGKSFIPQAMALKHLKFEGAKIIGIDPWSPEASVVGLEGEHLKWWATVDHERVFNLFNESLKTMGVDSLSEIHRCRSDEFNCAALVSKNGLIDGLHIDGNHGEPASCYDVDHYAVHVRVGGFLYFDDVGWAKTAVSRLPGMGFKALYTIDGGTMYQRLNYEML